MLLHLIHTTIIKARIRWLGAVSTIGTYDRAVASSIDFARLACEGVRRQQRRPSDGWIKNMG